MNLIESVTQKLSPEMKATVLLKFFGWWKIPMLAFLRPSVIRLDDEVCEIFIPLTRRSKNHLNSMYFAALAAGADCAGGLAAMMCIFESKKKVQLSFKNFKADFHKRADKDVRFRCESVGAVKQLVARAIDSGDRLEMPVPVKAYCEGYDGPVAEFELTLSLKRK